MNRVLLGVAAVAAGLSGCATPARHIERGADSGVIAIPANTNTWPTYNRRAAYAKIEEHLGPNFEIVEEREVAVGQTTFNNQQVNNEETWNTSNPFLPANKQTVQNTTTTRDVTEWRISYRRKAGPTAYAGAAPGVTPTPPGMPAAGGPGVQPAGLSGGTGTGVKPAGGAMPVGGRGVVNTGGAPAKPGTGFEASAGAFIPVGGR